MFKNVIAPIQAWLLSQSRCVGCGRPLDKGKKEKTKEGEAKVICECGRIYIYDSQKKIHRRALFEEV